MKKFLLLFAMLPLLFASCAKESSANVDKEESVYYVKYSTTVAFQNDFLGVICFTNEKGEDVRVDYGVNKKSFEVVIGPVSRGFECHVSVTGVSCQTRIECSKDNSPFSYKAGGRNYVSYTIDY